MEQEKLTEVSMENLPKKKEKKKIKKGQIGWQLFMTVLFSFGMLLLCSGLYTAWTTYHDSDLIEPFVCSYKESDLHAREIAKAFENIASRAETSRINNTTFFSGNVNYGYCVSIPKKIRERKEIKELEEKQEIIYSNIKSSRNIIFDANICSLLDLEIQENRNNLINSNYIYYDCYWWDIESDPTVIYQGYDKSRVKVSETVLNANHVSKIGICYSEDLLQEKETSWQVYASFMYFMVIFLLLGGILSFYSGTQLLLYGKLTTSLRKCFLELPILMILFSILGLYSCYERKISLFASQNHMEMLETSVGTVQLFIDIIVGAFLLASCFFVLFLGLHILIIKTREHTIKSSSLFLFIKNYKESGKHTFQLKEISGKLKYSLHSATTKFSYLWKLFWGFFTGRSTKGNAIAESERKRTLFSGTAMIICTLAAIITYFLYSNYYFYFYFCILFIIFIFVYLLGSIYNTIDYAKLEQMIEKVSQGNYQDIQLKTSGISKWSPCFTDAEKLVQIGDGFQKAVEKQIHAERLKIELLTNVSHDLKTPLTSIISYVELLCMEENLSKEAKDCVLILKKKSERLKTIISEVFELAKTTSGEIQIEKKEIDFYRLIIQTLGDMQDQIDTSGLKIKKNLSQKNVMVFTDGERMYRVLQNLFDNALKYSLKGTRIYVDLISEQEKLLFTIKNIAGYEMDFHAEDITERFARGDKNRTTEGSGLGLSIAEGFTTACGGTFHVTIDGDMFKVMIQFPTIHLIEETKER